MADINDLKDICISNGTLRAEDLLPRFMGILKDYAPEKFNEFIKGYPELDGWEDFLDADWRIISDDTKMNASDELFGLLNDIAPEGTMFSSTEGDGADFGFWTVEEKKEESKDITTLTDLKKFILSKNDNSVVFGVNSTGDLYFVDSVNGKEVPASADSLAVAEDDSDEHGKRIGNQGTGYFVVWKNGKRPTYMTALQIYDELLKIARSCAIKEKLLYDDEGEKALKQMAKDGKSTGEVAADIRYDVATALDKSVEKAEDLMTKFGLDNIYVLRAKGLSPKAIAKKILKACESKTEAALRPWRTDFEKALQKRIDDAKGTKYDTKDFIADGWEFVTGDVYDDGSEYGSAGKDVAVAFFKRELDGQYYRMWLAFDPDTKEITDGKWWIESDESKDERRDSADYLQEVWDALVSVWDKEKFDMAKGYDDEYECETITIASKDNEGVRAKIYVDDHDGKHPVGFDVIYRYPGDKGVGDLGYYEFQSTDFDETAPEIFAYFDELKGKIKAESKIDDSENILLFQTAKGSEANDAHDALEKLYLDNMDNTVDVVAIRMEDDGDDYYRVYATGKRSAVSKFLELYAQNFGKDAFTDSLDSMWTEPRYFKDLLITESMGDNWVAYYFCEDPQGLEWAVLPHAINGIGNASCVNSRGGNDSIAIEYVLDKCTPIEDVKGSGIYGKVKELEDRDIVALTRDEAERIVLADNRLKELKAVVAPKDESKNEDLNTAKDFVYSIAPIGILVRQASQPGFKVAKNSSDHIIVSFMHHDNTRFIIDWDADKKQGTATRQVMVDDKDAQYGYKWVTPKSNANVTFTTREELKDFVEGSWDNTSSESKKSEDFKDFTLNQLRYFVKQGWSKDLTNASDEEIQEIIDSGHEISGVSNGTYGMNGLKITYRNPDGTVGSGVVIGRVPNLFALLTPLPPKKDESKNESLTLKQKELKDMARYGEAEDITTISDAEAKELKKKGIETVGVSRGTYGMNGALLRDNEGKKYVITARSSNLFYFV